MQLNPKEIIERGIVIPSVFTEVQQVGIDLSVSEEVALLPGKSKNILLNETIKLPDDIYAQFFQRSSYSRKGVFTTTGIYDPGYEGSLGCTLYNMGDEAIIIPVNTRVGQLVCYSAQAASSYNGQWQGK